MFKYKLTWKQSFLTFFRTLFSWPYKRAVGAFSVHNMRMSETRNLNQFRIFEYEIGREINQSVGYHWSFVCIKEHLPLSAVKKSGQNLKETRREIIRTILTKGGHHSSILQSSKSLLRNGSCLTASILSYKKLEKFGEYQGRAIVAPKLL